MAEAKRVLLVGTFLSSNFNASVGEDLAKQLSKEGWEVILTSRQTARLARLMDMVRTAWQRRNDYAVAQVDVYSGWAFGWAEAVCWTLRRAYKPYVLTLHGGNLPVFAQRWPRRVRLLLKSAAAVTTPSRYLLEQMVPYRKDLGLLPNPLNVQSYPYRMRSTVGPRLVWLRAFHSIYNPSLAPTVVARLKQAFPTVRLTMVGPDKGDGSLRRTQEAARQHGVEAQITFPGGVPNMEVPCWLGKGDIFLNTASIDNTPVSVLEAMACGLCVVSTNVGGIPYLLEHEHDALLVPPEDPEAMAQAVQRILTEPELAGRLSRNARRKAEQFDWSVVLPQWEDLLSGLSKKVTCDEAV